MNRELSYWQYQKTVRIGAWKKFSSKHGIVDLIISSIVSLFIGIIYWYASSKSLESVLISLATLGVFWVIYSSIYLGYFSKEHFLVYKTQQEKIVKLKHVIDSRKANLEVQEYSYPNYGQSKKVGISIQNNDKHDVFPRVKIVGIIRRTEYKGQEKIDEKEFRLPDDNRILGDIGELEFNDSKNMLFAEIDKNNISLLLKNKLLLNSLFDGDTLYTHIKWRFYFELFGDIKDEKFENGTYFICIEARKINEETFLKSDGLRKISEPEESFNIYET